MKILLIDNNDSFTNNLEHLLAREIDDAQISVLTYAEIMESGKSTLAFTDYDLLVISPGPGCPSDYPGYEIVIESGQPVLGICLGMQIINEYFGGRTTRLAGCYHGRSEGIYFAGKKINVARYHSLYCVEIGNSLEIVSANGAGVPMAVCHNKLLLLGYQFHPESFLTEQPGEFVRYALDFFKINQL